MNKVTNFQDNMNIDLGNMEKGELAEKVAKFLEEADFTKGVQIMNIPEELGWKVQPGNGKIEDRISEVLIISDMIQIQGDRGILSGEIIGISLKGYTIIFGLLMEGEICDFEMRTLGMSQDILDVLYQKVRSDVRKREFHFDGSHTDIIKQFKIINRKHICNFRNFGTYIWPLLQIEEDDSFHQVDGAVVRVLVENKNIYVFSDDNSVRVGRIISAENDVARVAIFFSVKGIMHKLHATKVAKSSEVINELCTRFRVPFFDNPKIKK